MASMQASLVNAGGTNSTDTSAPVSAMASLTVPKTGSSWPSELDRGAGLAGVDAADDVGAGLEHQGGVLGALPPVMPWTMILESLFR